MNRFLQCGVILGDITELREDTIRSTKLVLVGRSKVTSKFRLEIRRKGGWGRERSYKEQPVKSRQATHALHQLGAAQDWNKKQVCVWVVGSDSGGEKLKLDY